MTERVGGGREGSEENGRSSSKRTGRVRGEREVKFEEDWKGRRRTGGQVRGRREKYAWRITSCVSTI